jgi:hypothetical protein
MAHIFQANLAKMQTDGFCEDTSREKAPLPLEELSIPREDKITSIISGLDASNAMQYKAFEKEYQTIVTSLSDRVARAEAACAFSSGDAGTITSTLQAISHDIGTISVDALARAASHAISAAQSRAEQAKHNAEMQDMRKHCRESLQFTEDTLYMRLRELSSENSRLKMDLSEMKSMLPLEHRTMQQVEEVQATCVETAPGDVLVMYPNAVRAIPASAIARWAQERVHLARMELQRAFDKAWDRATALLAAKEAESRAAAHAELQAQIITSSNGGASNDSARLNLLLQQLQAEYRKALKVSAAASYAREAFLSASSQAQVTAHRVEILAYLQAWQLGVAVAPAASPEEPAVSVEFLHDAVVEKEAPVAIRAKEAPVDAPVEVQPSKTNYEMELSMAAETIQTLQQSLEDMSSRHQTELAVKDGLHRHQMSELLERHNDDFQHAQREFKEDAARFVLAAKREATDMHETKVADMQQRLDAMREKHIKQLAEVLEDNAEDEFANRKSFTLLVKQLETQVKDLYTEKATLITSNASLQHEVTDLSARLTAVSQSLHITSKENAALKLELQLKARIIDAFHSSHADTEALLRSQIAMFKSRTEKMERQFNEETARHKENAKHVDTLQSLTRARASDLAKLAATVKQLQFELVEARRIGRSFEYTLAQRTQELQSANGRAQMLEAELNRNRLNAAEAARTGAAVNLTNMVHPALHPPEPLVFPETASPKATSPRALSPKAVSAQEDSTKVPDTKSQKAAIFGAVLRTQIGRELKKNDLAR